MSIDGAITLGMKSDWSEGTAVDLQPEDHARLRERCFFETADGGLRVNDANRGEPFSKGMDVRVGDGRVFLDDSYDLGDAITLLEQHAPAADAGTPTP